MKGELKTLFGTVEWQQTHGDAVVITASDRKKFHYLSVPFTLSRARLEWDLNNTLWVCKFAIISSERLSNRLESDLKQELVRAWTSYLQKHPHQRVIVDRSNIRKLQRDRMNNILKTIEKMEVQFSILKSQVEIMKEDIK